MMMIMILMIEMIIAVPLTPHSRAAVFLGTGTKSSLKASYDDYDENNDDDDNDDDAFDHAVDDDCDVTYIDDDQYEYDQCEEE